MKLSEIKAHLNQLETISFQLPDGSLIPSHFHVTEVGNVQKTFIDCGGKLRESNKVSLQLWEANDYDHRLHPEKLVHILELAERQLKLDDNEIEVEYQGQTIQRFGVDRQGDRFVLTTMQTDCLAKSECGIPTTMKQVAATPAAACCGPDSNCC